MPDEFRESVGSAADAFSGSSAPAAVSLEGVDSVPRAGAPGAGHGPKKAGVDLGRRVMSGFVYMLVQTLGVRVVRFGGSLVLAWLLFPDDFALFGLATTLHQFISVLKNAGLRDILINRQAKLHVWINPAAWMSMALGVTGGLLMFASAPLLAMFFDRPEIVGLVIILALATPFQSLGQVPMAMLHAQLRFKAASLIEAANNTALMLLTILFAWAGLGAISFVLPMLILAVARTGFMWWLVRPPVRLRPQFRRWRYILGDSARLISADIARTLSYQGDYLILGRMLPGSPAIGHYFYAFQISNQSAMLFARNLDTVLFPALSSIKGDFDRHAKAAIRALKSLAVVGVPFCFLQAAVAEPLVLAVLPERFYPSIPYVVILSVGMAPRLLMPLSAAMLRSQGRFPVFAWMNWGFALAVVLFSLVAVQIAGVLGVAYAVSTAFALAGFAFVYVSLNRTARPLRSSIAVLAFPVLGSGAACLVGWWVSTSLPTETVGWNLLRAAMVVLVSSAIYVPLCFLLERPTVDDLKRRLGGLIARRRGKKGQGDEG